MDRDFQIKRLEKHDVPLLKKLIDIFDDVFENAVHSVASETYLQMLLEKSEFIALAAVPGEEVLGGLTAYELPMYYTEESELYLYDIAVKTDSQRKGIGKKLLSALSDYCRQHEIREMFVEAHEEDQHAVDFYHTAGGHPEKVVHFNFPTGDFKK